MWGNEVPRLTTWKQQRKHRCYLFAATFVTLLFSVLFSFSYTIPIIIEKFEALQLSVDSTHESSGEAAHLDDTAPIMIHDVSPDRHDKSNKRISARIERGLPYQDVMNTLPFNRKQKCHRQVKRRCPMFAGLDTVVNGITNNTSTGAATNSRNPKICRLPLPQSIKQHMDFNTLITTDLKILVMGDSVGRQMLEMLQEAAGVTTHNQTVANLSHHYYRITVATPVRGGGSIVGFRLNGMLKRSTRDKPLPPKPDGGWATSDVQKLRASFGNFDAIILEPAWGWIYGPEDQKRYELHPFTVENISEAVELSHELFGVSTVILQTAPFSNNVDEKLMSELNSVIWNFTEQHYFKSEDAGSHHTMQEDGIFDSEKSTRRVQNILVQDVGSFSLALIKANARSIGMQRDEFDARLGLPYGPLIAQVCAEAVQNGTLNCARNMFSIDGMHWCTTTLAGRFTASTACLLACAHNTNEDKRIITPAVASEKPTALKGHALRACESACNKRYMSLEPIDWGLNSSTFEVA